MTTGEVVVREIPGIGRVTFENLPAGAWLTQRGEPSKKPRRRYLLDAAARPEWNGEKDSVSSIVGTLDKPALQRWIEDQATRGAVQAERMGELAGVAEDDWMRRVRSLNLGASAKRDEGAERGTVIHDAMRDLAHGKVPNPSLLPETARPWMQAAVRMWLEHRPELVASEQIVCHPELRYAGRFDLLARVDGVLTLLDYKTGKGRVFPEAHWQTRLYAMALACEGVQVERVAVVGISDDGDFELMDCDVSEEDARALVRVFRSRKRVASNMAAKRKAAKAAR